jgi:hypothetical protein
MASQEELDAFVAEGNIKFSLFPENRRRHLKTLGEVEAFVNGEIQFWNGLGIQAEIRDLNEARPSAMRGNRRQLKRGPVFSMLRSRLGITVR